LKIDPSTNTTTLVGGDLEGEWGKWNGGFDGENGFIYRVPYNAKSVLKLNIQSYFTQLVPMDSLDTYLSFSGLCDK